MTVKTASESWRRGVRIDGGEIKIGSSTGSQKVTICVTMDGPIKVLDQSVSINLNIEQWKALVEDVAARLEKQQSLH